jgi:predicted MFS family arabinose efflux permease
MPHSDHFGSPVALAVGGLAALAAGVGINRFVYTPILPVMAEALHLSKADAGLIASANLLGYLIGALLAALPNLPGSRRNWLLSSLAICAVTTGAMGLVSSMPAFLALRFVGGVASACVLVLSSALVLELLAHAGHSRLSSLHFSGVGVGIAISALVVSGLVAAEADWRMLWYAVGVVALGAVAIVAWLVPSWEPARIVAAERALVARPRGLAALLTAYSLFGFGYVITATFLVTIVRASPSVREVEPIVWLVVGLAAVPSVAVWAKAASRFGIPRLFSIACVAEAVGIAASVLWHSVTGALFASALLGGTFMGLTALGFACARELVPHNPRPVLAQMTAGFGVGQIVGPILAGYLSDLTGGFAVPSLLAAGALIAASVIASRIPVRPVALTVT